MTNAQQLKGSYVDPLALNRFLTKKKYLSCTVSFSLWYTLHLTEMTENVNGRPNLSACKDLQFDYTVHAVSYLITLLKVYRLYSHICIYVCI